MVDRIDVVPMRKSRKETRGVIQNPLPWLAAGVGAVILTVAVATIPEKSGVHPRHDIAQNEENIYDLKVDDWHILCRGTKQVKASPGDTLSGLVTTEVAIYEPVALGQPDLSREAVTTAVAAIAGIENPNAINAGSTYTFPNSCEPATR